MEYYDNVVQEAKDVSGDENFWTPKKPQEPRHSAYGQASFSGTGRSAAAHALESFPRLSRHAFCRKYAIASLEMQKTNRCGEVFSNEFIAHFQNH